MLWAIAASTLALYLLSRGLGRRETGVDRLKRLHGESPAPGDEKPGGSLRGLPEKLLDLPSKLLPSSAVERLTQDLEYERPFSSYSAARLAGIRLTATLCFPLAPALFTGFGKGWLLVCLPLASAGFLLPKLLLSRERKAWVDSIRAALPGTADLLYAFVLGGRNLDQAFRGAAERSADPLRPYLLRAVREMELGASRQEAFRRLRETCPVSELSSLLRSLLEAERRGYALSKTLEVFSRELRTRRRDLLRAQVAKAPLKMLVPLVFLILPASVLLSVGPTVLSMILRMV